jgi:hypothetical protein
MPMTIEELDILVIYRLGYLPPGSIAVTACVSGKLNPQLCGSASFSLEIW